MFMLQTVGMPMRHRKGWPRHLGGGRNEVLMRAAADHAKRGPRLERQCDEQQESYQERAQRSIHGDIYNTTFLDWRVCPHVSTTHATIHHRRREQRMSRPRRSDPIGQAASSSDRVPRQQFGSALHRADRARDSARGVARVGGRTGGSARRLTKPTIAQGRADGRWSVPPCNRIRVQLRQRKGCFNSPLTNAGMPPVLVHIRQ